MSKKNSPDADLAYLFKELDAASKQNNDPQLDGQYIVSLKASLEAHKSQISNQIKQLATASQKRLEVQVPLEMLRNESTTVTATIKQYQEVLKAADAHSKEFAQKSAQAMKMVVSAETKLATLNTKYADALRDTNEEIAAARITLESLKVANAQQGVVRAEKKREILRVKQERQEKLADATNREDELEQKKKTLQAELNEITSRGATLFETNQGMVKSNEEARQELEELKATLHSNREIMDAKYAEICNKTSMHQEQLDAIIASQAKQKDEIEALETKKNTFMEAMNRMRCLLAIDAQIIDNVSAIKQRVGTGETQLREVQDKTAAVNVEIAALTTKISIATEQESTYQLDEEETIRAKMTNERLLVDLKSAEIEKITKQIRFTMEQERLDSDIAAAVKQRDELMAQSREGELELLKQKLQSTKDNYEAAKVEFRGIRDSLLALKNEIRTVRRAMKNSSPYVSSENDEAE